MGDAIGLLQWTYSQQYFFVALATTDTSCKKKHEKWPSLSPFP